MKTDRASKNVEVKIVLVHNLEEIIHWEVWWTASASAFIPKCMGKIERQLMKGFFIYKIWSFLMVLQQL